MFGCLSEEVEQNKEIERALHTIAAGEEFAFYNLSLSLMEVDLLNSIEITERNNIILHSEFFKGTLEEEVKNAVTSMSGISIESNHLDHISDIFIRLTRIALGQVGATNFEMHIRTKKACLHQYSCTYWHLDKSQAEVAGEEGSFTEKRFIMPLKGSGTNFQKINTDIRSKFLEIAEEYPYYYGHNLEGCLETDKISNLLDSFKVYKPEIGFGSVHVAAKNGAMHAEPNDDKDRLLLIITPIE